MKTRKKSGELVVLFYYKNKKSFSLPASLFSKVLEFQEAILLTFSLFGDCITEENHGIYFNRRVESNYEGNREQF